VEHLPWDIPELFVGIWIKLKVFAIVINCTSIFGKEFIYYYGSVKVLEIVVPLPTIKYFLIHTILIMSWCITF